MKIQNMAIILVIILLPITLVLSAYTKTQIDTISIQTLYRTKLRDATYDAVTAFQLNTSDNTYSTVSDSMRRDVTAAIQTFIGDLAKNLSMSGATDAQIKPYIPAIVFTLYDGYYIYAPSYKYTELNDENNNTDKDTVNGYIITGKSKKNENGTIVSDYQDILKTDDVIKKIDNKEGTYEHVLKPYIYYTVRYKTVDDKIDVVVNYSLDNYVVVYGNITNDKGEKEFITKAGYLVNLPNGTTPQIKESEKIFRRLPVTMIAFEDNVNKSLVTNRTNYAIKVENVDVTNFNLNASRLENGDFYGGDEYITFSDADIMNSPALYNYNKRKPIAGMSFKKGWYIDPKSEDYYVASNTAKKYYEDAQKFTKWFVENLGNIKESDAKKVTDGQGYVEFKDSQDLVFDIGSTNDPEDPGSRFNEHKREIIKLSIQDNLSQAITSYNQQSEALGTTYNFKMPILSENEWDQVLKNVCMITFMQGVQTGTKIFNDYAIVTSTKNKEYISPNSIYFVNEDENGNPTGDGRYHKIGCSHLKDDQNIVGYRNLEFERFKYEDEVFKKDKDGNIKLDEFGKPVGTEDKTYYYYMHQYEACYYCIVNETKESDSKKVDGKRLEAYNTAMAREKSNFYKTNAYLTDTTPPTNDKPQVETIYQGNGKLTVRVSAIMQNDDQGLDPSKTKYEIRYKNTSDWITSYNNYFSNIEPAVFPVEVRTIVTDYAGHETTSEIANAVLP